MEKLKICLISLTISPDTQDGSAKFFRGILDYLKSQNHNVQLITAKWNLDLNEKNVYQINVPRNSYLWVPQFVIESIKFIRNYNFDIIHCNGPKGTLPLLFKKNSDFISTIHDLGPIETDFSRLPIEKLLILKTIKKANIITTCSEFIKKEIKFYFPNVKLNNIFNLYSAIENKFRPCPEEAKKLREKYEITGPIILYIGRITKYKGVDDLIQAYKLVKEEIKDVNLIIGGTPDFSMKKHYELWKDKYEEILFLGHISEEEIPWYYSMADLFVTYSYAGEGFGLTPIEAIACGTPVICSSLYAYKEVLKDNAIFVLPQNPSLLAQNVIDILKDKEKRVNMINKAQNFIKRYTWNSVGQKLEEVYKLFLSEQ